MGMPMALVSSRVPMGHNQISQLAIWLMVSSGIPTLLKHIVSWDYDITEWKFMKNVPNHLTSNPLCSSVNFGWILHSPETCGQHWGWFPETQTSLQWGRTVRWLQFTHIYIYMICISGIHLWPNGISIQKETHLSFFKAPNQCVFCEFHRSNETIHRENPTIFSNDWWGI